MGLTKVSQATAGRNLWIVSSKYPRKYPQYYVRQWASIVITGVGEIASLVLPVVT